MRHRRGGGDRKISYFMSSCFVVDVSSHYVLISRDKPPFFSDWRWFQKGCVSLLVEEDDDVARAIAFLAQRVPSVPRVRDESFSHYLKQRTRTIHFFVSVSDRSQLFDCELLHRNSTTVTITIPKKRELL